MKKGKIGIIAATLMVTMLITGIATAQQRADAKGKGTCQEEHHPQMRQADRGPFGNYERIPDITPKQSEDIKAIRISLKKEVNIILDEVNEKEAKMRTLTRKDQPDGVAIDKLIDEIAMLQASKRKKTEKARQEIRKMLNEEQKLWFDDHCQGMMGNKTGSKPNPEKNHKSGRGGR